MTFAEEALSATEAASVTGVPLKQVHRIVDAGLLGGATEIRSGMRVIVGGRGLVGLTLAHQTAGLMTPNGRRRIIARLLQKPHTGKVEEGALAVDVRPIESTIRRKLNALERAKRMVAVDKGVLNGTPCFRGTRIPVHDIAAMIANGDGEPAILEAYPKLTSGQIGLAVLYAEAYPRRGRPPRKPSWRRNRPVSTERLRLRGLPKAT